MGNLQYKNFVWPQNPERYQQHYVCEPVYTKNDAGETVFSGMGPVKRTFTGSGVFFGSSAYENFKTLATLFAEKKPGGLNHPIWGLHQAFFTELELTQEPRSDYVAYRFAFREANTDGEIPY